MDEGKDSWDHLIVNNTLKKVAKSTVIVAIGTLISAILFFIIRLIIIRNWSQVEFGIYSLAISIPVIILVFSTLGLKEGVVRNIAFARSENDEKKVSEIMSISITIYAFLGLAAGVALFLLSDFIAVELFHEPDLVMPLKIFSTLIPLTKILGILSSFFRGFDDVKPVIYYNNITKSVVFLVSILIIVWFNLAFINVFYAFSISMMISCSLIIIHGFKNLSLRKRLSKNHLNSSTFVHLLTISLPLWGTAMIIVVVGRADVIMLAGIKDVTKVALYEAAVPIAQLISFPLGALSVIYMPVISGLYAKRKHNEIKRNYTILTKWLVFIALPIFLVFFLFTKEILTFLYGQSYVMATTALRIASFQGIITSLLGLNSNNLIVIGKTAFITISYFIAATLNIILNFILIPRYGVSGAAFASFVSMILANGIMSVVLYKFTKVHPFSKNLVKPILLFFVMTLGFYFVTKNLITYDILYVVLFYIISCLALLFSILITKSVDKEDSDMIEVLERKTGLKLKFIKSLFKRAM